MEELTGYRKQAELLKMYILFILLIPIMDMLWVGVSSLKLRMEAILGQQQILMVIICNQFFFLTTLQGMLLEIFPAEIFIKLRIAVILGSSNHVYQVDII